MISGDPTIRQHLRDLPSSYLLDLLADGADMDRTAIHDVLYERGIDGEEVAQLVSQRQNSRLPRGHVLWRMARNLTLASTFLIVLFNVAEYYRLLHGHSPLKGLLLGLTVAGVPFGFFVGYKLTTHIYQGDRHQLYCGFPMQVGTVDLQSGQETIKAKFQLLLAMAINATAGLALVLFPLLLIHHLLN